MTGLASATGARTGRRLRDTPGIARGAAVIGGLTVLSRIFGLVRTVVFAQTVGATCLGTAYATANQVPNLVYELVLGGALTSAMVPVLARSAERSATDPAEKALVSQITSALLTWSVLILVPLTLIIIGVAGPVASLLNPVNPNAHCVRPDMVATTAGMLRVFAPQVVLYGLSVVLFGLLQALPPVRRVCAGAARLQPRAHRLLSGIRAARQGAAASPGCPLPLSWSCRSGTTLGIAALVLVPAVPTWRLHLRLRPVLRFPPGVARRAGGLALVGVIELVASDVSTLVVITLANGRGSTGALVLFNYASQVFSTLNAVLASSIVLSVFPVLAARDGPALDQTSAGSTRAVVLAAWLGTAVIAAVAVPAAHVLAKQPGAGVAAGPGIRHVRSRPGRHRRDSQPLPGDAGHRTAEGRSRGGSWRLGCCQWPRWRVLAELVPAHLVVAALALGNNHRLDWLLPFPLVIMTRRIRGAAAVHGIGRATLAGLAAAAAGAMAGAAVSNALHGQPQAAGCRRRRRRGLLRHHRFRRRRVPP